MDSAARLLEDIVRAPDDDQARLVWADAIGGERGELVALQCDLERGGHSPVESGKRRQRIRELIDAHGWEWSGLDGISTRLTFRRGFVDDAYVAPKDFVTRDIFKLAPLLQTVDFGGFVQERDLAGVVHGEAPIPLLRAVLEHPNYRKLAGVRISDIGISIERDSDSSPSDWISHVAEGGELALALGAFENLRAASFGRCPDARMVEASAWATVERAHMSPNLHDDSSAALFRSMPRLRALHCGSLSVPEIAKLPPGLTELHTQLATETEIEALADSPVAATLECLYIHHVMIGISPDALARFPKLRFLHLSDLRSGYYQKRTFERFAALSLPNLRELHVSGGMYADDIQKIAEAFGPQLELLTLWGHTDLEALRPLVAGDVCNERSVYNQPPLHTHPNRGNVLDWPTLRK